MLVQQVVEREGHGGEVERGRQRRQQKSWGANTWGAGGGGGVSVYDEDMKRARADWVERKKEVAAILSDVGRKKTVTWRSTNQR